MANGNPLAPRSTSLTASISNRWYRWVAPVLSQRVAQCRPAAVAQGRHNLAVLGSWDELINE
jgi:hypothetical protein